MSQYKSLMEQFVTLWVVLDELRADADSEAVDALHKVQDAAYAHLDSQRLPGQFTPAQDYEQQNFELCANDTGTEQVDGYTAFGMGFYSSAPISNTTVRQLLDATLEAYRKGAEDEGQAHMAVRFVRADRQNVLRVTKTEAFNPDDAEPAHPTADAQEQA